MGTRARAPVAWLLAAGVLLSILFFDMWSDAADSDASQRLDAILASRAVANGKSVAEQSSDCEPTLPGAGAAVQGASAQGGLSWYPHSVPEALLEARAAFRPTDAQKRECAKWLRKAPIRYTSQYGQDVEFQEMTRPWFERVLNRSSGVYIELAAYHPRNDSNTYFMDVCLGWHGVCIEGDPAKHPPFEARPRNRGCVLVKSCVAERDGKEVVFESHPTRGDSQTQTLRQSKRESRDSGKWFSRRLGAPKMVNLRCKTLSTIAAELGLKRVDFMSLDVEGSEKDVLTGTRFSDLSIDFIQMETPKAKAIVNAKPSNRYRAAADILRRNGYHVLAGMGERGRGRVIDTLFLNTQSPWMQRCSWQNIGELARSRQSAVCDV